MKTRSRTGTALVLAIAALLLAAVNLHAQTKPSADGVVSAGEYSHDIVDGPIHIFWRFDATTIYLAVEGKTSGWVAIGLDSNRMNGAKIFMGYVSNGSPEFTTQTGVRHSHSDSTDFAAREHAIGESGGVTTMEIVLDRGAFVEPGQSTLDLIFALGRSDSFRQYHSFRGTASIPVQ